MTFEHWLIIGERLLVAILAGALIGFEREFRQKAAGLKTITLITLGACLFMILSLIVGLSKDLNGVVSYVSDPGRIAAQIVSGIGFIGAGTILMSQDKIRGLTTAATIWVAAGIGMIIGLGYMLPGFILSVGIVLLLLVISLFEKHILGPKIRQIHNDNKNGNH